MCPFHMDSHPPTHVQLQKKSKWRCLGYDVFVSHASYTISWESFAHMDQQKTYLGYVILKP